MGLIKILLNENDSSSYYEREEIERTISELNLTISASELIDKFKKAPDVKIPPSILQRLENTDYNEVESEDDIKGLLKQYGRDSNNINKIKKELESNKSYPPLILNYNHKYYLVAGNTRLMVMKVLNIKPIVKLIYI
jgi:hypothetical protein